MSTLTALYQREKVTGGRDFDIMKALLQTTSRVLGAATTLKSSDGGSVTTAVIQVDVSAGEVVLGGVYKRFGALDDQSIVGTTPWTKSFKLDGTAAAVLSANSKDYHIALVCALLNDVPTLYAVFGDEAATAAAVAPTSAQCKAALDAANVTGLDTSVLLIVGRILAARGVGTVALTHTDPASNDALQANRTVGITA